MVYRLEFDKDALAEWEALDNSVKFQLRKKLLKRLENPHVPSEMLHGDLSGCYKIKNNKTGHRLVYGVQDHVLVVYVLAVNRRDKLEVYRLASERLK